MKKNFLMKTAFLLTAAAFFLLLNSISQAGMYDPSDKCIPSTLSGKTRIQILVVNCQSVLYPELCAFVDDYFTKAGVSHELIRRNHDDLSDILSLKWRGFDLLIISGSSKFFPDSPEVEDVASLLRMAIEENKYAFGACFGLQMLAYLLDPEEGRLVKKGSWDEDVAVEILKNDRAFENIGRAGDSFTTRQYHHYSVSLSGRAGLEKGEILAKSKDGIEILRTGNIMATQFHPESRYASNAARRVLENYLEEFISRKAVEPGSKQIESDFPVYISKNKQKSIPANLGQGKILVLLKTNGKIYPNKY